LIAAASERSQVIVVTHATSLVAALEQERTCRPIVLEKELSETVVRDAEAPAWTWPAR
jgi:predicted ATPase